MSDNKSSQISLAINIVLAIAVVILFVKVFSSSNTVNTVKKEVVSKGEVSNTVDVDTQVVDNDTNVEFEVYMPKKFTVAYVNTDSLWDQYIFVKEALVTLSNSEAQMKRSLEAKAKKLQDDYENYVRQGKAGLLTLQQQKDTEASLKKQQQEGVMLEQQMSEQLMNHKQAVNNQLTDTIISFLNKYREEHNYTLILQYGYSSGLLSATPELDITKDVIKRLNAKYKFEKSH